MILQAVRDIAFGRPHEKHEVASWVQSGAFITVCDAADLHPDTVKRAISQISQIEDHEHRLWIMNRLRERL